MSLAKAPVVCLFGVIERGMGYEGWNCMGRLG